MSGSDDARVLSHLREWTTDEVDLLARTGLSNMRFGQAVERLIAEGKVKKVEHARGDFHYRGYRLVGDVP